MHHERIATLLASNLKPADISSIVGITPSRISQIMKEDGFNELYLAKLAEMKEKDQEELSLSAKYLVAEHSLIDQVTQLAPQSELRDVTAALRVIVERQDRTKQRMNPILQGQPVYNTYVQLNMPVQAVPNLEMSARKEIISVNGRNLTPLSSEGVISLFKEKEIENHANEHNNERVSGSPKESAKEALSLTSILDIFKNKKNTALALAD